MTKTAAKTPNAQSRRRPTVRPLWRRPLGFAAIAAVALSGLSGLGWWGTSQGWFADVAAFARARVMDGSAVAGLTVQEILVVGRYETKRADLLGAMDLERGAPILDFDPNAARERIVALPWVRDAVVERMLPDTVLLRVEERQPLALWQNQGEFTLIDDTGEVIAAKGLDRFGELMVLVGEDASEHAVALFGVLATQPKLMSLVRAAVRVGGRRWNLRLENGIDVRLPEEKEIEAWARLAEFERDHKILARDVEVLDLRIPDRLIVRRPKGEPVAIQAVERDT